MKISDLPVKRKQPADLNPRRWLGPVIGVAAVAAVVALLWHLLHDTAATRREVNGPPMVMVPPPPPPPPPEPEKLPEPTPEKVQPEVREPEPTPAEAPKDDSTPSPNKDLGDPVTMDSAAQAGTDAFGIAAGRGGGMTGGGGGLGAGSYSRYFSNALQQAFARDPRTRQLVFDDIRVDVWLDADGRVSRVQLVQGTGNTQTDDAVLAMVRDYRSDEKPPASWHSPARISIKGRRP
ncbi:energy transducer TonB [Herbaspirillum sp. alder98]|uniref:energy transducer TonB family protein n=1 Tax=Herbaspirillum sp. alder98 TaxID=2913096 RepID=UPI001CD8F542|nr:energy transducer TonB [Herbaspirillum sp. alder98]MCA1325583.1 energy transducer TonB [Herbaspirillum sp. alder98]